MKDSPSSRASEERERLLFRGAFGDLELERRPRRKREERRAWDSADQLLLSRLQDELARAPELLAAPLVVGDRFGALTLSLLSAHPHVSIVVMSGSAVSWQAIRENAARNGLLKALEARVELTSPGSIKNCSLKSRPPSLVLLRLPKSGQRLAFITAHLARYSAPMLFLVGVMRAELGRPHIERLRATLGEPVPSRTVRRAQTLCISGERPAPSAPPLPSSYRLPELDLELCVQPGVFSAERLDLGARFLLEQLDQIIAPLQHRSSPRVIDLGCGSGVLGLAVARALGRGFFQFIDEDALAVQSAEESWQRCRFPEEAQATFSWADGSTQEPEAECADLILLNPPFHQGRAVDEALAIGLFRRAGSSLTAGGALWVVCNRHLPHQRALQRLFQRCDRIAENPKFVLLRATEVKRHS